MRSSSQRRSSIRIVLLKKKHRLTELRLTGARLNALAHEALVYYTVIVYTEWVTIFYPS